MMDPRAQARQIFEAGVAAADPYAAVQQHIGQVTETPAVIIAVGKAARRMAKAALAAYPGVRCLVVTNYENAGDLAGATVYAAGHPVPDENGAAAARAVLDAVAQAGGPVLALISGGGSALLPAPVQGVSLADKAKLNEVLLAGGLDIARMNLVRQQVSQIKGGGLVRVAAGQPVTALILSDVVGDNLSTIASGPTVAPLGTSREAVNILKDNNIWNDVPSSIQRHLERPEARSDVSQARNILVGSNAQSVAAMAVAAGACHVLPEPIEGDVAEAAQMICNGSRPGLTLWGGETTVRLVGTGKGGRNQELALRIAQEAARRGWTRWTCLQGGSDGRDGPVDAAGGLVDQGTLARIAAAGGNVQTLLGNNDSYAALGLAGDLLMTGATGTNVADLGVLIRA